MKKSRFKKLLSMTLVTLISFNVSAHDFWIEAEPFYLTSPNEVDLRLRVGEHFVGDAVPNIPEWFRDFSYLHQGQRKSVNGSMGDDPAGKVVADKPGLYIIGYENHPEYIELGGKKFTDYLHEQGLEKIVEKRHFSGKSDQAAQEFYQRCVKALVRVGKQPINIDELTTPLGYVLEITPLNDPFKNQQLTVQVTYQGKPAANLLLHAYTKENALTKQRIRTDANGQAIIELKRPGTWNIRAVDMQEYLGKDADWISYWASLTFAKE